MFMIRLIRALGYGSQALFNDQKKLLLVTTQAKTQNLLVVKLNGV